MNFFMYSALIFCVAISNVQGTTQESFSQEDLDFQKAVALSLAEEQSLQPNTKLSTNFEEGGEVKIEVDFQKLSMSDFVEEVPESLYDCKGQEINVVSLRDVLDHSTQMLYSVDGSELKVSNTLYPGYKFGFPNVLVYHPYHFVIPAAYVLFPLVIRKGNSFFVLQERIHPDKAELQSFRPHYCVQNGSYKIDYTFWHSGAKMIGSQTSSVNAHGVNGTQGLIASPDNFHLPALNFGGVGEHLFAKATVNGHTYYTMLACNSMAILDALFCFTVGTADQKFDRFSVYTLVSFLEDLVRNDMSVSGAEEFVSEMKKSFDID